MCSLAKVALDEIAPAKVAFAIIAHNSTICDLDELDFALRRRFSAGALVADARAFEPEPKCLRMRACAAGSNLETSWNSLGTLLEPYLTPLGALLGINMYITCISRNMHMHPINLYYFDVYISNSIEC